MTMSTITFETDPALDEAIAAQRAMDHGQEISRGGAGFSSDSEWALYAMRKQLAGVASQKQQLRHGLMLQAIYSDPALLNPVLAAAVAIKPDAFAFGESAAVGAPNGAKTVGLVP